jgi:hypothetical protein
MMVEIGPNLAELLKGVLLVVAILGIGFLFYKVVTS